LQHCETPYLVTVPCDCPHFPTDLVKALAEAEADIVIAAIRRGNEIHLEPAFCLMKRELVDSLLRYMQTGQRKIERWTAQHRRAEVVFADEAAFFNINTPEDLA
jgi:molybdopterin-guanine dinucleotide biosynthesis protein A